MSKWILNGNRPYWWSPMVMHKGLDQYPVTCETGPGNPSGHCWIIATTVTFLLLQLNKNLKNDNVMKVCTLLTAVGFMAVAISRCIIAAHFPHQVVLGLLAGIYCGRKCEWKMINVSRSYTFSVGCGLFCAGMGFYYVINNILKFDINWSVSLAELYCKKLSWVRKSTLPLTSIVRTSICVMAYAIFHDKQYTKPVGNLPINIIVTIVGERLLGRFIKVVEENDTKFNMYIMYS